mgnify:FL=1
MLGDGAAALRFPALVCLAASDNENETGYVREPTRLNPSSIPHNKPVYLVLDIKNPPKKGRKPIL